ncbi:MAG: endonuclease [Bacteroidetes bacterium]|nr:endonuclease [Bacteroidota bacterium]
MKNFFFLFLFFPALLFSQSTIFTETFGAPSGNTAISAFEASNGFDNDNLTMTDGGAANPADVRNNSTASTGYANASGAGQIYFTTQAGSAAPTDERGFAIEGIDASPYSDLKLSFAVRKEGGAGTAFANFAVQFWDGSAYQNIAVNGFPTSSNAVGWYFIANVALPPAAQINGLKIRFVKTGSIACRLDDVTLTAGSSSGGGDDDTTSTPATNISLSASSLSFGQILSIPSLSQNFSVAGTNLTNDIVITAPANFEISLNNSSWITNTITLLQSNGSVNTTTVYARYNPSATGAHNGTISFSSAGVETQSVSVSGTYTTVAPPSSDYYSGAYRLYGTALRAALHNIIKGHSVVSYDGLYSAFPSTDSKPNGKVWDIYSDVPGGTPAYEYTHGQKKCGSYSGEGDCYNREHSWCDSWLGQTNPARSDLFHMYPTDGYVNNRRSNFPFGKVGSVTWTSTNGGKLGTCSYPGYTGTVFEPIDEYKGDIARSTMYMSVRYYTEDSKWITTPATNKSDLLSWYANLLYDWSIQDTVSVKELNRNNAIFSFQKNRNPFIDHPEFAAEIWKTNMAPAVVSVSQLSPTKVLLDFSRYLDSTAAVVTKNFELNNSIGNPNSIQWDVNNDISKIILTVPALTSGTTYSLSIKNLKSINNVAMNDTVVTLKASAVLFAQPRTEVVPKKTILEQNFPNPFNPTTTIGFMLEERGLTTLKIFDAVGREIATLVHQELEAGRYYSKQFDASGFSSGMYFARLQCGNSVQIKKMILMK